MAEEYGKTIEYEDDSSPVQMLVVPEDKMAELKEAIKNLGPQEARNEGEENGNGGGEEEVLPLSGTQCRRTRRRDWHCGDGD